MGDSANGNGRRFRLPLLVVSFAFLTAFVVLGSEARVLQTMAPAACEPGSPAAIQGGPTQASTRKVVEIVTGWHAFARTAEGATLDPTATDCVSVARLPAETAVVTDYSGKATVQAWLFTDLLAFAPLYFALLVLVLLWARTQQPPIPTTDESGDDDESPRPPAPPEYAVLRAAWWMSMRPTVLVLLVVGLVADLAENVLLLRRLDHWWDRLDSVGRLETSDLGLGLVRALGWIKWIALLLPLLTALVFALRQVARAVRTTVRALADLWLQVVLVLLFALAVAIPDQAADAVRRLSIWQWVGTLVLLGVFGFTVMVTAAGVLKPASPQPTGAAGGGPPGGSEGGAKPGWRGRSSWKANFAAAWRGLAVLVIGLLIAVVGRAIGWHGLVVPGGIVMVVGLISAVVDVLARFDKTASQLLGAADVASGQEPPDPDRLVAVRRVATCLAAVPVAAFGVATVRATAGDLALIGPGDSNKLIWRLVVGSALTVAAGPLVLGLRRLLGTVTDLRFSARLSLVGVLLALHAPAILLHDPDFTVANAHRVGALGILTVFLSGFALIPTTAAWVAYLLMRWKYTRPIALPSALRILRLRSTPILGLLVAWAVLGGTVDYSSYHDVRRTSADGRSAAVTIDGVAAAWLGRQASDAGSKPALLVAASGGGIRAAYWTAAVLDCIIERDGPLTNPCEEPAGDQTVAARRRAVLLMSGISGGSLGLAEYVVAVGDGWPDGPDQSPTVSAVETEWYEDRLGDDFLAPTVAAWLFNDGANALLRPRRGVDRAAVMERAWEEAWPDGELGAAFVEQQVSGRQPLLLLNGYSVEDGCRLNTSALATAPDGDVSKCRAVESGETSVKLLATADLVAQLCPDEDVRFSTAALASARFPFVSPAGRLAGCRSSSAEAGGAPQVLPDVEVVDGGYRETSGASTIVELWPHLRAALTEPATSRCAGPLFLQIDNGYASDEVSTSGEGVVGQFVAPLVALQNSAGGQESGARQASRELFTEPGGGGWYRITTFAHPGSSAPLGWVLSGDAKDDLARQLILNASTIVAIRERLAATSGGIPAS